ncbi:MAG: TlpA disulfide reductase family protein [Candidatus Auribacterota bacterium]
MSVFRTAVLLLILTLSLYGCGKKEDSAQKQSGEKTAQAVKETEQTAVEQAVRTKDDADSTLAKKTMPPVPAETSGAAYPDLGKAVNFSLPTLDGSTLQLSDMAGKVVVIDFWATWCPPCRKMIPDLKALYSKYKDKGLEIVGISLDEGGVDAVKSFTDNVSITYPIVMGNRDITKEYGYINAIPTSFVVDKQGVIRNKHTGYRSADDLEKIIKDLLALN